MSDKLLFQNKYRIASTRLQGYDYGSRGNYFITICTKHRQHRFGYIKNGYMCLSRAGQICYNEILETPKVRTSVVIDTFVVMPNHVHMIVSIIDGASKKRNNGNVFGPQSHNIPAIIRGFKGSVTSKIRKYIPDFQRQSRYHDTIIRDAKAYRNIFRYIDNNITAWSKNMKYGE